MVSEDRFAQLRADMVAKQLVARGIKDPRVLNAMRRVPRHLFVPDELHDMAYADRPLPLGPGQTISQPYIVALMLESLALSPAARVLEIGTGSGYQAALLCELVKEVFTVEIDPELADRTRGLLERLGYDRVKVKAGDGHLGWKEEAPFDAVIISAATDHIPRDLVRQTGQGGRMILPLGDDEKQYLVMLEKTENGLTSKDLGAVRFVEMKGEDA